jgi:hypothetical protein
VSCYITTCALNSDVFLAAEPPRIDGGELLLTKAFLDACSETYGIVPIGQDAKSNMFHMKFLNIIDPLRIANNLGRSVSKGTESLLSIPVLQSADLNKFNAIRPASY